MIYDEAWFFVAHPDDEIWSLGTLQKLITTGTNVYYFSFCREHSEDQTWIQSGQLQGECEKCLDRVGVPKNNRIFKNYRDMYFEYSPQEIRQDIYDIRTDHSPDLVFLPSSYDYHQDHLVVHNAGVQAFTGAATTVLGYVTAFTQLLASNRMYIPITEYQFVNKVMAAECYNCQAYRSYSNTKILEGKCMDAGLAIGEKYAEVFEVIKAVGI